MYAPPKTRLRAGSLPTAADAACLAGFCRRCVALLRDVAGVGV